MHGGPSSEAGTPGMFPSAAALAPWSSGNIIHWRHTANPLLLKVIFRKEEAHWLIWSLGHASRKSSETAGEESADQQGAALD